MKRHFVRLAALAVVLVSSFLARPAEAAADLVFLCINDTFVGSLTSSNMPIRINNNMYISYRYLSRVKPLKYRYDDDVDTLRVYNTNASLTFDLSKAVTYDQDGKIYSYLAERRGGVLYVPIEFICRTFGFYYSQYTTDLGSVLRINSVMSRYSDQQITEANAATMQQIYDNYYKPAEEDPVTEPDQVTPTMPEPVTPPPQTPQTQPEEPDEPAVIRTVYPVFLGELNRYTADILSVLQLYDVRGTFFVFEDDLLAQADNLRALVGQEQSIGLCVPAENAAEAAESLNELLSSLVLRRSRLVCIKEGSEALSAEQRQALHEAGYRLWDPSVSPQTDGMSAYALGRAAKTSIDGAPRIVCLGLQSDAACASALETILSHIRSGGSNCVPIEDWTTPVNASGDYT